MTFDPAEVERERGVVLEEWRLGLGADARMRDAQMPLLLNGSRYAERLPIGQPDVLRNASVERLKQFYKDWYRPDLMAVIVVGDFDPAAVDKAITARFSQIPATLSPASASRVPRAGSAGHALRRHHGQGSQQHRGRRVQLDGGARSANAGRLSAADGRPALYGHALRPAR